MFSERLGHCFFIDVKKELTTKSQFSWKVCHQKNMLLFTRSSSSIHAVRRLIATCVMPPEIKHVFLSWYRIIFVSSVYPNLRHLTVLLPFLLVFTTIMQLRLEDCSRHKHCSLHQLYLDSLTPPKGLQNRACGLWRLIFRVAIMQLPTRFLNTAGELTGPNKTDVSHLLRAMCYQEQLLCNF